MCPWLNALNMSKNDTKWFAWAEKVKEMLCQS